MALTHPPLKFDWNPELGMALQFIHCCNAQTVWWIKRCQWMRGHLHTLYNPDGLPPDPD